MEKVAEKRSPIRPSRGAIAGRTRLRALVLAGLLPGLAALLAGQETSTKEPLARLEQHALLSLPELEARRRELEALRHELQAAGALEDPMLEVEARRLVGMGADMPFEGMLHWVQRLPPWGVRAVERQLALRRARAGELELLRLEAQARKAIRQAAFELWMERQSLIELEALHRDLELQLGPVEAAVGSGAAPVAELLEARRMLAAHGLEVEAARARWWRARAELSKASNWPASELLPELAELPAAPASLPELDRVADRAWAVLAAELAAESAAFELELARAGLRPGWSLGAGLVVASGGRPDLSVRGAIELPIFRRQRELPRLAALEARLAASRARIEQARLEARTELLSTAAELERARRVRELSERQILPLGAAELEARGLEPGRAAAARARLLVEQAHARLGALRARAEELQAWAALESLAAPATLPALSPGDSP